MPPARLGQAIREARSASGVSLRELARRIGVSAATVSAIETGKTQVSVSRLHVIASALQTTAAELIERDTASGRAIPMPSETARPPRPPRQPRPAARPSLDGAGLATLRPVAHRPSSLRRHRRLRRDRLSRGDRPHDRQPCRHERSRRVSPLPQQAGSAGQDIGPGHDGTALAGAGGPGRGNDADRARRIDRRIHGSFPHPPPRVGVHRRQRNAESRACQPAAYRGVAERPAVHPRPRDRRGRTGGKPHDGPSTGRGARHFHHVHVAAAVVPRRWAEDP